MNARRRLLVAASAGVALQSARIALAQTTARTVRLGFLGTASASGYLAEVEAIRAGLRDRGYVEGRNLTIEYRWAEGDPERLKRFAAELVALNVDILITHSVPGARAAMQATKTTPIVLADAIDPVETGLVASLARPGGNVTGSTSFQVGVHGKRLELLAEVVPGLRRVAHLVNSRNSESLPHFRKVAAQAATSMNLELREFAVQRVEELPAAFIAMASERVDAALIGEDPQLNASAATIAALALTHRLPTSGFTYLAKAGGLIGYGANREEVFGRSAYFVDRIVRGAKPGEIPMEGATRFQLLINPKTAKTLGIRIPQPLLQRAELTD